MDSSIQQNEILVIITIGIIVMMVLALAFVLFFYFSQKKFQAERLFLQEQQLMHQQQLLFSTIKAQEIERERIAKDLHDSIGSKLNVINLGLHRLGKLGKDTSKHDEVTEEIFKSINDTIATTRRISHDLLPPTLANFGLKAAMAEFCDSIQQSAAFDMAFEVNDNNERHTDKQVELNLFRIVQELTNNSIKHGSPTQVFLRLWLGNESIKLEYQENGKGFDMEAGQHKTGLGMQNIESRMKMIGATYDIDAKPGMGLKFSTQYTYPA